MPLGVSMKQSKSAKYDLQDASQRQANNANHCDEENAIGANDNDAVYGVSISQNESQFSYIPNMNTTKSLAVDIIQLTRYRNRRPSTLDDKNQRKPSFRNIFLGVPEIRRRFSHDIRGESLAPLGSNMSANKETKGVLILQVFLPFLLSGFGNVGAGIFLNFAQTWPVFRESSMFYILLATVMAFKTNLEATLAARLSTCSNMGSIKTGAKKWEAFVGNLALVQTQSVIFGAMAGSFTVAIRSFQIGRLNLALSAQVVATSMAAIVVNELLSSFIILAMVVASERAGVNPDNVSTLIAAMLGDFTSVFFVSITALLFQAIHSMHWVFVCIIVGLFCFLPLTCYIATNNSFTRNMFLPTHLPLTLAVVVATLSGLVFDHAIRTFARIAIYQAVVNGVSVNLMAVQTSRISTYLQQLNNISPERAKEYAKVYSPIKALYAQDMNASVSRWLIAMCVPAISVYLCFIFLVCPKDADVTFYFIGCCVFSIVTQVTCVQCLTYLVTPISWRMDWDPDNVVIPVLMSISDCLGNAILLTAFIFLKYIGDPNSVGQVISEG